VLTKIRILFLLTAILYYVFTLGNAVYSSNPMRFSPW